MISGFWAGSIGWVVSYHCLPLLGSHPCWVSTQGFCWFVNDCSGTLTGSATFKIDKCKLEQLSLVFVVPAVAQEKEIVLQRTCLSSVVRTDTEGRKAARMGKKATTAMKAAKKMKGAWKEATRAAEEPKKARKAAQKTEPKSASRPTPKASVTKQFRLINIISWTT